MALFTGLWLGALIAAVGALIHGDLTERRLANELLAGFYVLVVAGWIVAVPERPDPPQVWIALGGAVVTVVLGLALWAAGLVGAGDVKLAPAVVVLVASFGSDAWLIALGGSIVAALTTLMWAGIVGRSRWAGLPLAPTLLAGVVPAVAFVVLAGR